MLKILVMKIVLLLLISVTAAANSFSLTFFDERFSAAQHTPFQDFFNEIEEEIPTFFKNNIRYPMEVTFAVFDYNKIELSCRLDRSQEYARLTRTGRIEVNEKLLLPILNRRMDREHDDNCTFRQALEVGIRQALYGHMMNKFREFVLTQKESAQL